MCESEKSQEERKLLLVSKQCQHYANHLAKEYHTQSSTFDKWRQRQEKLHVPSVCLSKTQQRNLQVADIAGQALKNA